MKLPRYAQQVVFKFPIIDYGERDVMKLHPLLFRLPYNVRLTDASSEYEAPSELEITLFRSDINLDLDAVQFQLVDALNNAGYFMPYGGFDAG